MHTIENYNLAHITPHAQEDSMDADMHKERYPGHVVVPEKGPLVIECPVCLSVFVNILLLPVLIGPHFVTDVVLGLVFKLFLSFFSLIVLQEQNCLVLRRHYKR